MIPFTKIRLEQKEAISRYLLQAEKRSCEYSFANLFLWGHKKVAEQDGFLLIQSQFDRKNVYIFPVGEGDLRTALDALICDAEERGIRCCLAALTETECQLVEQLYPGKFHLYCDRDSYDYVYAVDDLADLKLLQPYCWLPVVGLHMKVHILTVIKNICTLNLALTQ